MNALVFQESLRYEPRYPDPVAGVGEVLVAVKLAGICSTDLEIVRGYMGFTGVPGHEFVGTVVNGPKRWKGQRVVAEINCVCGQCSMCQHGLANHCRRRTVVGIAGRDGVFADLVAVPEANLHAVPENLSDEQAVFVEPLAAAFQVIRQVPIEKRMKVAVVGSGRLGLLVAQVLRTTGCKLDVVGRNPLTLGFCDRKGIQATPVSEVVPKGDRDVVVECSGAPEGFNLAANLVRPRGTIVLKSTYAGAAQLNLAKIVVDEINVVGSRCGPFADAINALARGEIEVETMVSRTLPLSRGVEAFALADDPRSIKVLLRPGG
ncbi:MAG TPA: alcohol dehydrogenase catalytic domain-containing protein [Phycisphaerae bacterium]|nr:alcohol dehydrogenase catalytic domain-containing protein [Phycisphaerae bacterium]HOJ76308.1 alcohol dehydrogenase catalytic domain-containing protein [Phycisphaerae bacterium]HOM53708.1 alcohol dehydrogenase catalytic domain-containing protein [Phycisphaerae bacterium]HOQ87228.1 alcohol dehydrogenase catalytic domain-containing protein [Phycisphaerae bacterium]HPP29086.1 alcohol dehydrogenase catalytic domain-containing protein [Phycisphaerae bacterium]